jgi:hypothetical protein
MIVALEFTERLRDVLNLVTYAPDHLHDPLTRDVPAVGPVLELPWLVHIDAGRILRMSHADGHAVLPADSKI